MKGFSHMYIWKYWIFSQLFHIMILLRLLLFTEIPLSFKRSVSCHPPAYFPLSECTPYSFHFPHVLCAHGFLLKVWSGIFSKPCSSSKVVWYSHLHKNFPQFVGIHTVKGLSIVSEAEGDVFWNSLALLWSNWWLQFGLWFLYLF